MYIWHTRALVVINKTSYSNKVVNHRFEVHIGNSSAWYMSGIICGAVWCCCMYYSSLVSSSSPCWRGLWWLCPGCWGSCWCSLFLPPRSTRFSGHIYVLVALVDFLVSPCQQVPHILIVYFKDWHQDAVVSQSLLRIALFYTGKVVLGMIGGVVQTFCAVR